MNDKEIRECFAMLENKIDALHKCIESLTNLYEMSKKKINYLMELQKK
ncbi:hypothetical protein LCGC14_2581910 [marine sediment metagenome]|uniref:Uncharacterized protein n=1 Tax=marine sediment metagenome TaxID=412755 RepID=A0A0F9AEL0_9ZZZZ